MHLPTLSQMELVKKPGDSWVKRLLGFGTQEQGNVLKIISVCLKIREQDRFSAEDLLLMITKMLRSIIQEPKQSVEKKESPQFSKGEKSLDEKVKG